VAALVGLYSDRRPLRYVALGMLQEWRAVAAMMGTLNAGYPEYYAVEAGRRVHLFPAPSEDMPLALLYQRPLTISTLPPGMDRVVLHGVLGRYGRHFDRDALSQDPAAFEQRYEADLRTAGRTSWDVRAWSPNMLLFEPLRGTVTRALGGEFSVAVG
jgi:hypothetical protein